MKAKDSLKIVSLLLLCLPSVMMVTVLTSSVIYIYQEYAHINESLVTMILTIPNLTVLAGLLLSPVLLKKFSIKTLIVTGMVAYTIGGVVPMWCENFYLILFFRALLGLGCGVVIPLQTTLIATYPEKKRAMLMGASTVLGCAISALFIAVSGVVAIVNWRYVFLMYAINAVILVLVILFLPKNLEDAVAETQSQIANNTEIAAKIIPQEKQHYSDYLNILIFYYVLLVGSYLFVPILTVELSLYLDNTGLGGSAEAGVLMAVYSIGTALAGMMLEKYTSILKGMALPIIFLIATAGFFLLWIAPTLMLVGIAAVLLGTASCLIGCVVDYKLSCELPLSLYTAASAGTNFCIFVMNFISPVVFVTMLNYIPGGSYRILFMVYALIQAALFVVALVLPKLLLKRN